MLLVVGASGILGSTLAAVALASGRAVTGTYMRHPVQHRGMRVIGADLGSRSAVKSLVAKVKPASVVNCAAFTSVDGCETDPDHATLLNVKLPGLLARECMDAGVAFAQISTDSVFDGARGGYTEGDAPAPLNVYARTKLEGERAVLDAMPGALVIRTNFIGSSPTGRTGLADWMRSRFEAGERIAGFTDVIFSPLLAADLAGITLEMLDLGLTGIYHLASRDSVSKYEFARRLGQALGADTGLVDASSIATSGLAAPRPLNTSLSPLKAESVLGRKMADVDSVVSGYAARFDPLIRI